MRQAATRELFDYWNRLRGERGAPERSEVDLAAISKLLADTFLLEIDVAHRFPFLMSGSRVNALFCDEPLLPLRVVPLDWNIFCSTCAACCGSPLFMWKT